jgi:myo-inositol-1(or 4)-monophosphatase
MSVVDLENELKVAKKAALAAGETLKTKKNDLNIETFSSERDIKLEADVVAETLIKKIIQDESDIPILAEESGKSSENLGDIFWVIDPLDGTANYSRNIPICCVSIALIRNLIPVIGVVYDFNNNDLYIGSSEQEAMLNDKKISVSNTLKHKDGVLVTGLPNGTDYSDQPMIDMIKDFQGWRKVRMIGSAAMASVYVASGKADVYKELGTYLWDVSAGAAIVNAAGGTANILNQKDNFQVDVFFSNSKISD